MALTLDGRIYAVLGLLEVMQSHYITLYAQPTLTVPTDTVAGTPATSVPRTAIVLTSSDDHLLNALIEFGNATTNEEYLGLEVWDDPTAGSRWMGGALVAPASAVTGQPVRILAGAFVYTPDS